MDPSVYNASISKAIATKLRTIMCKQRGLFDDGWLMGNKDAQ